MAKLCLHARLAPRRVAHPLFGRGWGDGSMYHQNINKSLKTNNKYFELIIKNLHTALLMRVIRLLFVFAFFPFLHAETFVCSFSILQNLCVYSMLKSFSGLW